MGAAGRWTATKNGDSPSSKSPFVRYKLGSRSLELDLSAQAHTRIQAVAAVVHTTDETQTVAATLGFGVVTVSTLKDDAERRCDPVVVAEGCQAGEHPGILVQTNPFIEEVSGGETSVRFFDILAAY